MQLFIRTKRSVDLTAPGRLLLSSVTDSLAQLDQGVREVRRVAGVQGALSVGLVEFPFVPAVFARFAASRPDVRLELGLNLAKGEILSNSYERSVRQRAPTTPMVLVL